MKKLSNKVNESKTSPVQRLKSVTTVRRKAEAEVSGLGKLLVEKTARRAELETTGDIGNGAVIAESGRLLVLVDLLPRRIAFKQDAEAKAEETLVRVTDEFVREHLGPRVRRHSVQTRELVRAELSPHFRDAAELMIAVEQSERVQKIERLGWVVLLKPQRGAMEHAEGALKSWEAVEEFEKSLL